MIEIIKSYTFKTWLDKLKDRAAATRIAVRIDRAARGNLGDWKHLREGISEMRINVSAGYRLYFTRRGDTIIILLCGGDKRAQDADIRRAVELAKAWKE